MLKNLNLQCWWQKPASSFPKHYQVPLWSSQRRQMTRAARSTAGHQHAMDLGNFTHHFPSSLSPSFLMLVLLCWCWAPTLCFCKAVTDPFLPRLHCSMAAAASEPFSSSLQAASWWCLSQELMPAFGEFSPWCVTHPAVSAHGHQLHPCGQWVPARAPADPPVPLQIRWGCTDHHRAFASTTAVLHNRRATPQHSTASTPTALPGSYSRTAWF